MEYAIFDPSGDQARSAMSTPPTIAWAPVPSVFVTMIRVPSSTYAMREPSGDHATSPILGFTTTTRSVHSAMSTTESPSSLLKARWVPSGDQSAAVVSVQVRQRKSAFPRPTGVRARTPFRAPKTPSGPSCNIRGAGATVGLAEIDADDPFPVAPVHAVAAIRETRSTSDRVPVRRWRSFAISLPLSGRVVRYPLPLMKWSDPTTCMSSSRSASDVCGP